MGIDNATMAKWYADNRVQGTSERFRELDRREGYWKGLQFDGLRYDWDLVEVQQGGQSFRIQSESEVPLKMRRPTIRYNLVRVAVDVLTGYLFGHGHLPSVTVRGNPAAATFCQAIADEQWWARWADIRGWGGGIGTAVCVVKAVDGMIRLERVNPKFVTVEEWHDEEGLIPSQVRIDRLRVADEPDPKQPGKTIERLYLHRRIIDTERDVAFAPVLLTENGRSALSPEAVLAPEELPEGEGTVTHGLEVCPVIIAHNLPAEDDDCLDGLPDCDGAWEIVDAIARQASQLNRAVLMNQDPTLILKMRSQDVKDGIARGSFNALAVGPDGAASYLEMSGSFSAPAAAVLERLEAWFQRIVGVVLPDQQRAGGLGQGRALSEFLLSQMLNRVGKLRTQYAPMVARSFELARTIAVVAERSGQKLWVAAPDTVNEADGASGVGGAPEVAGEEEQQWLPSGGEWGSVVVSWPRTFVEPSVAETAQASQVVTTLATAVPAKYLAAFLAPHLNVEDAEGLARDMEAMAGQAATARSAELGTLAGLGSAGLFGDREAAERVVAEPEIELPQE